MHPDNAGSMSLEREKSALRKCLTVKGKKLYCELKAAIMLEDSIQNWKAARDKAKVVFDKRHRNRGEKHVFLKSRIRKKKIQGKRIAGSDPLASIHGTCVISRRPKLGSGYASK